MPDTNSPVQQTVPLGQQPVITPTKGATADDAKAALDVMNQAVKYLEGKRDSLPQVKHPTVDAAWSMLDATASHFKFEISKITG